jgi:glycosyl transferase, family 25
MRASPQSAVDPAETVFQFLDGWAEHILVVSLRRVIERRERLEERLRGLRYELFDPVDKHDLDRDRLVRDGTCDERRTRRAYRFRKDMTIGAIGCALSHRRLYEEMVANGWSGWW